MDMQLFSILGKQTKNRQKKNLVVRHFQRHLADTSCRVLSRRYPISDERCNSRIRRGYLVRRGERELTHTEFCHDRGGGGHCAFPTGRSSALSLLLLDRCCSIFPLLVAVSGSARQSSRGHFSTMDYDVRNKSLPHPSNQSINNGSILDPSGTS